VGASDPINGLWRVDAGRSGPQRRVCGRSGHQQPSRRRAPRSGIGKDEQYRIRRAEVILPVDAGEFTFYDCAYEELLQALGAINDDRTVPWTMFNDDVQMGFFDVYDQYLLNILPGLPSSLLAQKEVLKRGDSFR
jgi:hypothetical protein